MFTCRRDCDRINPVIAKQSKRDTGEKITQIMVRVPDSVRKELKTIAHEEDKSLNLLLEEIIASYLKKRKSRAK